MPKMCRDFVHSWGALDRMCGPYSVFCEEFGLGICSMLCMFRLYQFKTSRVLANRQYGALGGCAYALDPAPRRHRKKKVDAHVNNMIPHWRSLLKT